MSKQQLNKIRDWSIVIFYTLFIYITLPVAPGLWKEFSKFAGNFADYLTAFILGLTGVFVFSYLIIRQKDGRYFVWLAVLALIYAWGLSILELAIERIHFIEYGLLSILVFRALRHNIRNKFVYLWSGATVFFLGFLDEGIQYILPNRVYQTKDAVVNGLAGVLGLFLIGLCSQPQKFTRYW